MSIDTKSVLEKLSRFIRIQSVSGETHKVHSLHDAVAFLRVELESLGFEVDTVEKDHVPPLVIARRMVSGTKPTVGIYGHYDIQSEEPIEEWDTDPFELVVSNGKMFGRGVADNKGHIIQNLTAIRRLISQNSEPNIVCIFEGEEELGSEHFEELIVEKRDDLSCVDVFYIMDNDMYAKGVPQVLYALRGLVYFQLDLSVGTYDLHSGVYGNMALNPAQVMADLLTRMKDISTGEVQIPGFYDDVRVIPEEERKQLEETVVHEDELKQDSGLQRVFSVKGFHPSLVSKVLPSLDVNGMYAGFTGEGSKTIIPHTATVKFSCRLVPNQKANQIQSLVENWVRRHIPEGVSYNLRTLSGNDPFFTDINNPYMKKTSRTLARFFGKDTVMSMCGGSIGAAEVLQRVFQKPVIVTGFVLPDCRMHGPNEHFDEEMFWRGIEALIWLYVSL